MNQLVTIAIPTVDRQDYLKQAVASALTQTYSSVEILISQDPGKNGLEKSMYRMCQDLIKQTSKVRYQFNLKNLGLAGSWNALANAARGQYLVIIGDDDRLLPNFVEKLISAVQPNTNVAFSNHYIINHCGNRLKKESDEHTKRYRRNLIPPGEVDCPEKWVWQNSIPMSASLIRTTDVQRLRFKEDLNTPEIELFIRLAQEGGHFIFLPDYLSEYRIHNQSATAEGLHVNQLVNYLLPISVGHEGEPYKKELLSQLMRNAVSRTLLQGEIEKARELLKNSYYPDRERKAFRGLIQTFCARLPKVVGQNLYKFIYRLKNFSNNSNENSIYN